MVQKKHIVWFLVVGMFAGLIVYFVLGAENVEAPNAPSSPAETATEPARAAIQPSLPTGSHRDDRLPRKTHPQPAALPVGPTTAETEKPECLRDEDCRGPRHADCIKTTCTEGKCAYDRSGCECQKSEDCDDGDPCTRNHCFVPTMSCIFIPKDDCK